jgi:hypothetical protein
VPVPIQALRRIEIGIHHHIAGPYFAAYVAEIAWRGRIAGAFRMESTGGPGAGAGNSTNPAAAAEPLQPMPPHKPTGIK